MKVLIVNNVYEFGSTGKIVMDLEQGLRDCGVETIVCYARGKQLLIPRPNVYKLAPERVIKIQSFLSKLSGFSYGCSPFSTWRLRKLIEAEQPDVVNLHCVNANTVNIAAIIKYLKENHIKTVLSIHAEFLYTGGCAYAIDCDRWKTICYACPQFHQENSSLPKSYFFNRCKEQWLFYKKAYFGFTELSITCVSPWLTDRAKQSPFFKDKNVFTVLNGVNIDIYHSRDVSNLRKKYSLTIEKVILFVTPDFNSPIKGGLHVLDIARKLESEHPDYRIFIIGRNCDAPNLPSNVVPVSYVHEQSELAEYYALADLTLLASKRETFSMICAESLCCGTPIVGFQAGGPESISFPEYSEFVEYGDIERLYSTILKWIEYKQGNKIPVDKVLSYYSAQTMCQNYLDVYNK
jgi:glycosyltransferase involved in cell wall biosynthesis